MTAILHRISLPGHRRQQSRSEEAMYSVSCDDETMVAEYEAALTLGSTAEERRALHRSASASAPRIAR